MAKEQPSRRHRRGEGSTYPLKTGGWMAQLAVGYDRRTGNRRYIRRRAVDDDAAERALTRLQREWGRAGEVAFDRLDDYLTEWLDIIEPSIARSTLVSYQGHVDNHIAPFLGARTVGSLRPTDTHRLIRKLLDDGKSPATTGRIVTTLRMALQQAVRDGELTTNPADVKLPRVRRDPVEAMTPEQATAILSAAKKDPVFGAVYTLLLGTGMRAGEACALDWRDLDLDAATVLVRRGKTKAATRRVPLPAFVVEALVKHRKATPRYGLAEPVFLGPRRTRTTGHVERLRVSTISHAFPKFMERNKLPEMTLHQLRHGTATLLVAMGIPMRVVSEILGHANPSMTAAVYAHVSDASKRTAMDALEAVGATAELTE